MDPKVRIFVIGVGMTKFEKPGRRDDFDYPEMAKESVTKALQDAKVQISDIKQACVGYVYGDSTCGQRALYEVGMTGMPIYNVNNNCSTGSTALYMAKQILESGNADCVLALGFEKMQRGSLSSTQYHDRTAPIDKHLKLMAELAGMNKSPIVAQMFGNAGKEHMKKYGTTPEHLAKIAYKNHKHSVNNPYSQFQQKYTLDEIMNSPTVFDPLTKLQCCPTSDGSAAAILATEEFVHAHGLEDQAVEILGMELVTDFPSTFKDRSCMKIVGYDMTKTAAERLFQKTHLKPQDVDVVELHDCFSANELITYEALGLCPPGKAGAMIDSGNNTYGGQYVINPSGGLISKGHPLGATGLAQCAELCWQLRGLAERRQVPGAKLALQHNLGIGGAAVVALYKLGFPEAASERSSMNLNYTDSVVDPDDFKVSIIFKALETAMQTDDDKLIENVRGVYAFKVRNGPNGKEGYWIINARTGKGSVEFNGKEKPDVTFTMDDADIVDLFSGKLNLHKAFFEGKIKIEGKRATALKMLHLQRHLKKKIIELRSKL